MRPSFPVTIDEDARAAALLGAQARADDLFTTVDMSGLIRPGVTESQLSDEIRDLAHERYGVGRHWHKRIVRSGPNTLQPYEENPPDRAITDDDIVFLDLGPVFAEWEADFGRTYVLGDDPHKLRLRDDLPVAFAEGKAHFEATPDITGAQLYDHACRLATEHGWTYGGPLAGHLVGEFPHKATQGDKTFAYVAPGNDKPMRGLDAAGRRKHWILEIHFVDVDRRIGGFYEQLLTL
jgi:Xaa-Pro aminopeptidase